MNEPKTSRELAEQIRAMSLSPGTWEEQICRAIALIDNYVADAVYKEVEWWAMALVRENLHPTDMAEVNARFKAVTAAGMWRT